MRSIYSYIFKAFYDWLMDNNANPRILVDATRQGVIVPQEYVNNGVIVLSIFQDFISGLHIEEDHISFYTKFKGKPEFVKIPYYAMTDLVCVEEDLSLPLNMWLASIELSCHYFNNQEDINLESLYKELKSQEKKLHEAEMAADPSSRVVFSMSPIEEDEQESGESDEAKSAAEETPEESAVEAQKASEPERVVLQEEAANIDLEEQAAKKAAEEAAKKAAEEAEQAARKKKPDFTFFMPDEE